MGAEINLCISSLGEYYGEKINYKMYNEHPLFDALLHPLFSPSEIYKRNNNNEEFEIIFKTTVKKAKRRLDILGYTIEESKKLFEDELKKLDQLICEEYPSEENKVHEIIGDLTFDKWIIFYKKYVEKNIENKPDKEQSISEDFVLKLLVFEDESFLSYEDELTFSPGVFSLYKMRAHMDIIDENEEVILDLTDVINSGWLNETEIPNIKKQILLVTEGTTDNEFISKSMEILFKDYVHLYNFFDRTYVDSGGGHSGMLEMYRFALSANVESKIIFLFDNDSAANSSIKIIEKYRDKAKKNIKSIKLPALDLCESYPTIDSHKNIAKVNINGIACSIELFLGRKNLMNNFGDFYPIELGSLNSSTKTIQGTIQGKKEIQKKFKITLKNADSNDENFQEMKRLCEYIFLTFQ